MKQILIIAHNTFRESVRDKVLYNLVIFALMLIGASLYVGELTIGPDGGRRPIINLGLSAMLLFGYLIAVFIGTGLVFKEIDKRTIYSILSKPIHRHQFIVGKFLGLALTLAVNCAVMLGGLFLALTYTQGRFDAGALNLLPAAFLIYLELLLGTAVALCFSSFSTPVLSAFLSLLVYLIGNFTPDLKLFADIMNVEMYPALKVTQYVLWGLYYVLPNLSNFNFILQTAHGVPISSETILFAVLYFIAYGGILLSLTVWVFERRNFK